MSFATLNVAGLVWSPARRPGSFWSTKLWTNGAKVPGPLKMWKSKSRPFSRILAGASITPSWPAGFVVPGVYRVLNGVAPISMSTVLASPPSGVAMSWKAL
ncbi:hypothetical protein AA313_de0200516 [Arthrobotrys entomopaga]|nr:hypothetical protein AA313_de0200516 [Arthrobotrys entomopaga]